MQVIFIKAEFTDLVLEKPAVAQASLYADWEAEKISAGERNVQSNGWMSAAAKTHATVMSRPASCFDSEFYIMVSNSPSAPMSPISDEGLQPLWCGKT